MKLGEVDYPLSSTDLKFTDLNCFLKLLALTEKAFEGLSSKAPSYDPCFEKVGEKEGLRFSKGKVSNIYFSVIWLKIKQLL